MDSKFWSVTICGHGLFLKIRGLYTITEAIRLFRHMSNPELGRFLRSLSTISAAQMELGPEPAVIRRSLVPVWIVGYYAIDNSFSQSLKYLVGK